MLELGLRLADPHPEMYDYVHNGLRGWAFPRNGHGWANTDNPTYVQLNSAGFNDRERSLARRNNTVRIAVLGDSMTAETMIPKDKIFTSVMEQHLAAAEVLNFGINAYNFEQNKRLLDEVVWRYDPQIVLLLVTFENGIAYNLRELGYAYDSSAPYLVLQNGQLVPDEATSRMKVFGPVRTAFEENYALLANTSRIFLQFDRALDRILWHLRRPNRKDPPTREELMRQETLRSYFPDLSPEMVRAWAVSEKELIAIRDDVRAHGAEFWVAVPGLKMQTVPDLVERERFRKSIGATSLYLSDDRLDAFCAKERIPIIDTSKPMGDYALAHHVPLYGFGANLHGNHWNEQGNLIAGEIIAQTLAQNYPKSLRYIEAADGQ